MLMLVTVMHAAQTHKWRKSLNSHASKPWPGRVSATGLRTHSESSPVTIAATARAARVKRDELSPPEGVLAPVF